MSEQLNECRTEFEKWATPGGYTLVRHPDLKESYYNAYTEDAWLAWRAAWNRRAVPEGWVPAPKVPTEEMLVAGLKECDPLGELINWDRSIGDCNDRATTAGIYRAMLAAAPKPEEA